MDSYIDDLLWASVDIETTGINPYQYEIIEIGAVIFSLKTINKKFQKLIHIKKKQDPRAQKIHNITLEEVEKEGVSLREALEELFIFIGNYPVIFHNASFDLSFLVLSMQENKLELPHNYYYDNLFISRTYFSDRKSHSLGYLRKLYNIETGDSHRALSDAEATARVFMLSVSEKYEQLNSKKNFNAFLRYHRRIHKFKLQLNKNLDQIEKYFEYYVKTKTLLRIRYSDQEKQRQEVRCFVKEVMIFNQNIFIKALPLGETEDLLIPMKYAEIYDPDKGVLTIDNL